MKVTLPPLLGLASGVLFGMGLALSGMMDPARVRGFLDVAGAWDPTLAFVMGGAVLVMALAWTIQRRMHQPVACDSFSLPGTRRIDARLAAALMGIQAIKGVEVGDGFDLARRPGSQAHDEIVGTGDGIRRTSGRSGGTEGGMTTGEVLRVRAAMKPISTVPRALATVDVATGEAATALHQRSDVCAVAPAAVVAEAMVALVLADSTLEKFGGDSVGETSRNAAAYLAAIPEFQR